MLRVLKRVLAFGTAVMLLLGCCAADGIKTEEPQAAARTKTEELVSFLETKAVTGLEVTAGVRIDCMPLYSEERTGALNRLLQHLGLTIRMNGAVSEEQVTMDGNPVIGWTAKREGDETRYRFSFDRETEYVLKAEEKLSEHVTGFSPDLDSVKRYLRILQTLDTVYPTLAEFPVLFAERAGIARVQVKMKGYGTAVKRVTLVFTEEEMQEQMAKQPFFSGFVYSGKQKITLMMDEEDRLLRVYYNGTAGTDPEDLRNISLDWKCLRGEETRDSLQIRTPVSKGSTRDNLTLEREMIPAREEMPEQVTIKMEQDRVHDRVRNVMTFNASAQWIEETMEFSLKEKNVTGGTGYFTEITGQIQRTDDSRMNGTLEITAKTGKIETGRYAVDFSASACDPTIWQEETERTKIQASQQEDGARADAWEGLLEKAACVLLPAMISLPEEDLEMLKGDLPKQEWKELISLNNTER